ncbi:hypothetical protein QBC35DRAFT_541212 [Podospora australis]|uniref:Polyketide synthase n=1 Tax=Podospora australis TaxID=1536484 RepID=A0AAN6WLJ9_9PEZI|nr:hypothetical protein QBC35DRAFT_541212 [Podospora australis]
MTLTPLEPIAIIGSGCRFPGDADSPFKLWDLVRNPRPLAQEIPPERFSAEGFYHPNSQFLGHSNVKQAYFLEGPGTHREFDAPFFGMSPAEAMNLDPQCRHLLEAVYEALEASGLTLESLAGSDTAVYTGQMVADYDHIITRDLDHSLGIYHASGTSHAMLSNRISYFYGWHGPSMTIDTACSSSLVALHHGVQQLRSGLSRVAVATGANLILDPKCFISLSSLNMLSPDGRSRMWDADANGYARGEGIAAVVLKTLRHALEDGDHIECIIRETGFNQDGRSQGITSPSAAAQIELIRGCYARSGLDLANPADRPQFFECHGTGTMAGDAAEAEAISTAFFPPGSADAAKPQKLFVGSIKSIMGHTEGTAGLAGILKASLALQNAQIPPNLLFNRLNPRIHQFYSNLEVATRLASWPTIAAGKPRRASVNSFGFGGANVHAILESFDVKDLTPVSRPSAPLLPVFTPFVFSAASESALTAYFGRFLEYLQSNTSTISMRDLAYTLHSRRSVLQVTTTIVASDKEDLCEKLRLKLDTAPEDKKSPGEAVFTRISRKRGSGPATTPLILGVFTGQGAQYPRIAAEIISSSKVAQATLARLEKRLSMLPEAHRPTWSLLEELLKEGPDSRLDEATISQPLCTAVQILLVDMLRAAGVKFAAVVGHSSGEMAAAYAAGFLSAEDAICAAYYRGLFSKLAKRGAMMAVGTSAEDVEELCAEPEFEGRVALAAVNSPISVTLSGDEDAIAEMKVVLDDEKKFARLLKVDKAYHSHHMAVCSKPYLAALSALDIKVSEASQQSTWFSSVLGGQDMSKHASHLRDSYFDSNMVQPVLFHQAVASAYATMGPFDLAVEVGPHPALKGPVMQTAQEVSSTGLLYTGLLHRGRSAISAIADGLGYIWSHLGKDAVNLLHYERFISGHTLDPRLIKGLPKYAWDHEEYWNESRNAKAFRTRPGPPHELLGHMTPDSHEHELRWRHILRPSDMPWLMGHRLQNQIVFPGAAYVVVALEAAMALCKHRGVTASLIEISDAEFGRALVFDQDDSDVEVVISLSNIMVLQADTDVIKCTFKLFAADGKLDSSLNLIANGGVTISIGDERDDLLPTRPTIAPNLVKVNTDTFYSAFKDLDYQWTGPFVALDELRRKQGVSTGILKTVEPSKLLIHPALLDAAFQGVLLAYSFPEDGQLWTIHVPGKIHRITVNPYLCQTEADTGEPLVFDASHPPDTQIMVGDTEIYPSGQDNHAMIQVEGLTCVPLSRAAAHDDKETFASVVWDFASPNAQLASQHHSLDTETLEHAGELERVARFYLGRLDREIPGDHPSRVEGPYSPLLRFASYGSFQDAKDPSPAASRLLSRSAEMRLLCEIGEALPSVILSDEPTSLLDTSKLTHFHSEAVGPAHFNGILARTVKQLTHQNPHMNILEVGAGTGALTRAIFDEIGTTFSSYTFTDSSPAWFESAKSWAEPHLHKTTFQTLNVGEDLFSQGFQPHSYDLVTTALVLHAVPDVERALLNIRQLLKPGGHLIVLDLLPTRSTVYGLIFGTSPEWWSRSTDGQASSSPAIDLPTWHSLLQRTGFTGHDTLSGMLDDDNCMTHFTVFTTQATDDKIEFLRHPLSARQQLDIFPNQVLLPSTVVVQGDSREARLLAEELRSFIQPCSRHVTTVTSLQELSQIEMSTDHTAVLYLGALFQPVFQDMAHSQWDSLKRTLMTASTVFWVTSGRRAANPMANMMVGMLRSVVREIPSLKYQVLDFEERDSPQVSARTIAEAFLRFEAGTFWRRQGSSMPLSVEPELVLDNDGQVLVPRLVVDEEMNDRYNSLRRPIEKSFGPNEHTLSLVASDSVSGYGIQHNLLRQLPTSSTENRGMIEVSHALMSAIRVFDQGSMFLVCGKERDSQVQSVSFCSDNSSLVHPVEDLSVIVPGALGSEAKLLALVSHYLLTSMLLSGLSSGDVILAHAPDVGLAMTLAKEAHRIGVRAVFVTETDVDSKFTFNHLEWVKVHHLTSDRALARRLPARVAVYADFATSGASQAMGGRIRIVVQRHNGFCRQESLKTMFADKAYDPRRAHIGRISQSLRSAVALATSSLLLATLGSGEELPTPTVTAQSLAEARGHPPPFSVFDWTAKPKISALVRPIDTQISFTDKKTYWLVGLTGGLGLGLCEWMVRRGAKYFVLSSRSPNIDPGWLNGMREMKAVIKVSACDITIRSAVERLYAEISTTMPPIAGVAQGAMVLDDTAFRDMTVDNFLRGTRPKVEGSMHLNDLFQENTLDFFIFFSSVVSIIGRPGQANYSAANTFMASLARQRRQKGLASSIIHIGPIYGVGYAAQLEKTIFTKSALRGYALVPTSERDFYQLFAEAVVAGRPAGPDAPERCFELFCGARRISPHEDDKPVWEADPLMSHFIRNPEGAATVVSDTQSRVPLRTQLEQARDRAQVREIIQEAFLPKLYSLFQLDSSKIDKRTLSTMRLDEMGIDSLIAVEIRGWFTKTLEVNIPVLKMLSGIQVGEMSSLAAETIPEWLVPGLKEAKQELETDVSERDLSTSEDLDADRDHGQVESDHTAETPLSSNASSVGGSDVKDDLVQEKSLAVLVPAEVVAPVILKTVPLSPAQEMFWFVWEFLQDKTTLNHTAWARMTGRLSVDDFQRALEAVAQRHEAFRTRIVKQNGRPIQVITESSAIQLETRKIETEAEVHGLVRELQDEHVYDPSRGQTVRVIFVSLTDKDHYFVAGLHPLVADGTSFQTLLKEVLYLYMYPGAASISRPRQFSQYSETQNAQLASGNLDGELDFWRTEFKTLPPPLPILKVSTSSSRPPLVTYENERTSIRVAASTKEQIQAICKRFRATPFHFYLATFRVLLLRYAPTGDGEDVAIGIGDANRLEDDMMDVIGPFVNLLPVRLRTDAHTSFTDLLQHTRDKTYSALAHSHVPFQVLLKELGVTRSPSYTSLFQCFVNYRQGLRATTRWGPDESFALHAVEIGVSKMAYDVTLEMVDYADGDCLQTLIVRKDLYGEVAQVRRLMASYEVLLKAFAANPIVMLDQPDLFEAEKIQTVMRFGQGPSSPSQWAETIVHRIDDISRHHATEIAVRHLNKTVSYAELDRHAKCIARALQAANVDPGTPVAVLLDPTPVWVASLLGIMRAGAVYLPLDMNQPWARLATILGDSQAPVVLVDHVSLADVNQLSRPDIRNINVSSLVPAHDDDVPIMATAASPAAILYTSGSTGVPKGIMLEHRGLRNWAESFPQLFSLGQEVVLQQTSPTFDLSLSQLLTALCFGGSLVLIPRDQRGDAAAMTKAIAEHGVTFTCATPSEYTNWLCYGEKELHQPQRWRTAFVAGEQVPLSLVKRFAFLETTSLELFNAYGPTEATIFATALRVSLGQSSGRISAGRPLSGYSVHVLDEQARPVAPGVLGEIYIGGPGIAAGYFRKPQETAKNFVPDHLASLEQQARGWKTLHRTGDVGRWDEDGNLHIDGRISGDTQTKLGGLRIELAEVEHATLETAGDVVQEAVVSVRGSFQSESRFLAAHIVLAKETGMTTEECIATIHSRLSARLPRYMCPAMIIPLEKLPRTMSGKLDRRAIAELALPTRQTATSVENEGSSRPTFTDTELRLRRIWESLLDLPHQVGPNTDFFHVGGSSLLLPNLQVHIRQEFAVDMPLIRMFEASTLSAMAGSIDNINNNIHEPVAAAAPIDWDEETSLPSSLLELLPIPSLAGPAATASQRGCHSSKPEVVVLTGATGQLGRALLKALTADPTVRRIHCIGVRRAGSRRSDIVGAAAAMDGDSASKSNTKIMLYEGELGLPRLGLSEADAASIFSEADAVIHNSADMSYLKTYSSLRAANLQSTKELVEMCARFGQPRPHGEDEGRMIMPVFHYISTVSVGNILTMGRRSGTTNDQHDGDDGEPFVFGPSSVRHCPPPTQMSSKDVAKTAFGYVATKWASEVFLERLVEEASCQEGHRGVGWEVVVHRPSLIARPDESRDDDSDDNPDRKVVETVTNPGLEFAENLKRYSLLLKAVPQIPIRGGGAGVSGGGATVSGAFDQVLLEDVVNDVVESVMTGTEINRPGISFRHQIGGVELPLGDMRSWLVDQDQNRQVVDMEEIDVLEWADRAGALGMHATMVAMVRELASAEMGVLRLPKIVSGR